MVSDFRYAKVRALLAVLSAENRCLPRSRLAGLLWPDQPESRARANLSQALTTLRGALGDRGRDRPLIRADHTSVWLDDTLVDVDVRRVTGLLDMCDQHVHQHLHACDVCAERLTSAVEQYHGDFLDDLEVADNDLFERWAAERRHRIRQRIADALTALAARARSCGDAEGALAAARRLVALDAAVEANQRLLIRLLLDAGQVDPARHQFATMVRVLDEEIGVEPEPESRTLGDEIARIRPRSSGRVRPNAMPVAAHPIVGRRTELDAIAGLLSAQGIRALTITGCGGVGKTRLAVEAATQIRDRFADGAVFVDLSAVDDPTSVATAIAAALGVSDQAHVNVASALATELAERQLLLVLDNFEQVLPAAHVVADLLARCHSLTVIVTSRVPLGLRAEHQVVLEPLPDDDAVDLFTARAAAAGAAELDGPAVLADCLEICRRVDRLPLAIELVAAGARLRPPAALLRELGHPLALASRACDTPERHRTLRAAIQWSVDLLDRPTRTVFARLSVFAGGWTSDAAAALSPDVADVEHCLDMLIRSNMIRRDGERMSMLGTFRQVAAEQLGVSPAPARVRARHVGCFAHLAADAMDGLLSPDARAWTGRIAAEQDNLRAAFGEAMRRGRAEQALMIAAGPWRFHWMRGLVRDALDRIVAALAADGPVSAEWTCVGSRAAGTLAVAVGDFTLAGELLERAVDIARRSGDGLLLQSALCSLGFARGEQGELEAALTALEMSLALARKFDQRRAKFPLGIMAGVHIRLGNFELASELAAEGLSINRQLGDPEGTADGLRTLAMAVHGLGDDDLARRLATEALAGHRVLGHDLGIGLDMAVLGDVDAASRPDEAIGRYGECLRRWRRHSNPVQSARVLDRLALLLAPDEPSRSVELFAVAGTARDRANARLTAPERAAIDDAQERCRIDLGDARFQAARASGRALTLGQTIELLLCG